MYDAVQTKQDMINLCMPIPLSSNDFQKKLTWHLMVVVIHKQVTKNTPEYQITACFTRLLFQDQPLLSLTLPIQKEKRKWNFTNIEDGKLGREFFFHAGIFLEGDQDIEHIL